MATKVDAKLLKQTKFPAEFNRKVDMTKVNVEVMKKWIAGKLSELLGNEDDVIIELCFNLLEGSRFPDIKSLQIQLTGFLDKDTPKFCQALWNLCLSAQVSPQGVPKELLEAKKLELRQEKLDAEKAAEEARLRKEQERAREKELESIRQKERSERTRSWRGNGRGGREYERRRESRSPPPRRRSPPRYRDMRRGADSYHPRGSRSSRWQDSRSRSRSRSTTRSTSRSVSSRSPPRQKHYPERKRSTERRRRRSISRASSEEEKASYRRDKGRGLGYDSRRNRSNSHSSASRSLSPRRNRRKYSRSASRSRSRSASSRSLSPKPKSNRRHRRQSPSQDSRNDLEETRADILPRRRSRDSRRLSRSKDRGLDDSGRRYHKQRSVSSNTGSSHSPRRRRSPSPDARAGRKRRRSIQRYAPAARRRRNTSSVSVPDDKRRRSDEQDIKMTSPPSAGRRGSNGSERPENNDVLPRPGPRISPSKLREKILKEKIKALRRTNADGNTVDS